MSRDYIHSHVKGVSMLIQWLFIQDVKFNNFKAFKRIIDYIKFDVKTSMKTGTVKELKRIYENTLEREGETKK